MLTSIPISKKISELTTNAAYSQKLTTAILMVGPIPTRAP